MGRRAQSAVPRRLPLEAPPPEGFPCMAAIQGRRRSAGPWSRGRRGQRTTSEEGALFCLGRPREEPATQTRDRVNLEGEVTQEGVYSLAVPLLYRQRSSILLNGAEPARQSFKNLVWKTSGPEHLPHQPRRPRGVRINHNNRGVGVCWPAASPSLTRPVPE